MSGFPPDSNEFHMAPICQLCSNPRGEMVRHEAWDCPKNITAKSAGMVLGVREERVDHPAHYGGDDTYEHIKVVDAWGLDYRLGNCTKYICRAGKKVGSDELEDLQKALWYLQSAIDAVKASRERTS